MRCKTVAEALLRLCGSKLIGSATSPQLSVPPRLMTAGAAVGALVAAAGGALVAAGAVAGAVADGAQAAARPISPSVPIPLSSSRRVMRLSLRVVLRFIFSPSDILILIFDP